MKYLISLLCVMFLLTNTIIAFSDYNYDISGYDNSGNYVYGDVDVDQDGGSGTIYDEYGNAHSIDVEWTGYGELEAYDYETWEYIDLEVD